MDQRPHLRTETIKLEENIRKTLQDPGIGNTFLDMTPKAELNKWDYIKLGSFCCKANDQQREETCNRMGKKIFKPAV